MLWAPDQHGAKATLESISEGLHRLGARQWQIDIAGPVVEEAINRPVASLVDPPVDPNAERVAPPADPDKTDKTGRKEE
jgi:hypothetical protein